MRELTAQEVDGVAGASLAGDIAMTLAAGWAGGVAGLAAGSVLPGAGNAAGFCVGFLVGSLGAIGYALATDGSDQEWLLSAEGGYHSDQDRLSDEGGS